MLNKQSNSAMLIALSVLAALNMPAQAEESATTSGEAASKPIEGRVEANVSLNNWRDARLSISRVRKATANLYDEMNRQELIMMNASPTMVGNTILTRRTPAYTGQVLPPRKKWVDASVAEIGPIIKLFKEDVDAAIQSDRRTDVSDEATKQLDPLREQAFTLIKTAFDDFQKIEQLSAGPTFANKTISTASEKLDADMKELDKILKKGMSIISKEAKAARKRKNRQSIGS
ncbi:MAG: hypothetical protein SGJ27_28140 [Candidatus Melainabacteria bacterium]|nr:hypothetical protein [Candidatus Melainabacteria bacterium]